MAKIKFYDKNAFLINCKDSSCTRRIVPSRNRFDAINFNCYASSLFNTPISVDRRLPRRLFEPGQFQVNFSLFEHSFLCQRLSLLMKSHSSFISFALAFRFHGAFRIFMKPFKSDALMQ